MLDSTVTLAARITISREGHQIVTISTPTISETSPTAVLQGILGTFDSVRYIDSRVLKYYPDYDKKYRISRVLNKTTPKLRGCRPLNARHQILRFNPRYRYQFH